MDHKPVRRRIVLAVALLAVAVIALATWWAVSPGGDDPSASGSPSPRPTATASRTDTSSPSPSSAPTSAATRRPSSGVPSPRTSPKPSSAFTPGSLTSVPVGPAIVKPPVGLDQEASFGGGLSARVTRMEAVTGVARGPGEIAGPALRVTLSLANDSRSPLALGRSVVTLSSGKDRTPGLELSGPGVVRFTGSVPAGARRTASYVYGVPVAARGLVQVSVSYRASKPTVVFEGSAAG